MKYNYHCGKCGGFVAEPMVAYGYSGKYCFCENPTEPPENKEERVEVTEHADGTTRANGIDIFSPHTNEEMREEFRKVFPNLKWETTGGTMDIADFWLNKISDLKKSIREEIEIKREKSTGPSTNHDIHRCGYNDALDDILSLKSLE